MAFGKMFNNMAPYAISICMILYGALLLHHSNQIIKKKIKGTAHTCEKYSSNILLAQGIAISLVMLGVLSLLFSVYSKHPEMFQKFAYFGNVHTRYGGHPLMKYLLMTLVMGVAIFILVDLEKHKKCTEGIGGETLLIISNSVIIGLVSLYLIYKVYLMITKKKNT
jgi:hypothetical protein